MPKLIGEINTQPETNTAGRHRERGCLVITGLSESLGDVFPAKQDHQGPDTGGKIEVESGVGGYLVCLPGRLPVVGLRNPRGSAVKSWATKPRKIPFLHRLRYPEHTLSNRPMPGFGSATRCRQAVAPPARDSHCGIAGKLPMRVPPRMDDSS